MIKKNTYKTAIKLNSLLAIITFIFIAQSCAVKKYIPEGELLYTGAKIEIKADSLVENPEDLKPVLEATLSPEPNSKFLGLRPGLHYYYKMQQENPGFLNRWLFKQFGEEPVYQSDVESFQVEDVLVNKLENNGFFYSRATSSFTEDKKNKEAHITYSVTVPTPYKIETYQVDSLASPLYEELKSTAENSNFKKGIRFDLESMKLERQRLDATLKSKGYYNFNPDFLIFEADSNRYDNKRIDLFLKLKNNVPEKAIIPYKLGKVNIYPDYELPKDSKVYDSERYNNKTYIQDPKFFRPDRLDPFITLSEGQLYNPQTSKNTARRLSTIGAYKFVNIQYKETDSIADNGIGVLETNIYLSPLNKRAVRAEIQAVTKSNSFAGPALILTYSNRNLFQGGETLNISTKAAYETQIASGNQAGLSSLELGFETELIFPRVLFPIKISDNYFEYSIPKTKTSLGFDYLNRSQLYTLLSAKARFGYVWDANKYVTHVINPISTNYTKLSNTTDEFQTILNDNPFLERSFDQEFISGLTYSFTYNELVNNTKTHQIYANFNFDVAGNSISLLGKEKETGEAKQFLGLEYAQYAKADVDFRYHFNFGKEQKIATRLFAGYGLAYGNSDVLPFTKQYYSGGPYSVRAFRIQSLGPGTYNELGTENGTFFDQTGNIRLEANVEYRFPIFSYFKGAVFADAGNVWNSEENPALPGGKFSSDFLSELGMGAGVGLRVDVQGFVIRFDLAAPFHDPSLDERERFNFEIDEPILNFAIGYPF
ncbi:BamA/TamA family outer membrane protein [Lacinutrix sp. MedPE-SW]|uniref:translocation and assembly module lipoprotein TamL n=1 Tax=Lacinutrix sp. MedPE-SW TaxID=1860087 RepID=UPI000A656BFD|nr:BamA/TamA family outer membrane protein [Lacinutrix sp. MedPE-SW]